MISSRYGAGRPDAKRCRFNARQIQPRRRAISCAASSSPVRQSRETVRDRRPGTDGCPRVDVVESPGELALKCHRHAEERVRDTGVAPVEEEIAAVADEDLAVVEVGVIVWGIPADARRSQSSVIVGTSARSRRLSVTVTVSTPTISSSYRLASVSRRQSGRPGRGAARSLPPHRPGVGRNAADVQPAAEVAFALDNLTQGLPAIRHEHPTTVEIGREQPGDAVRPRAASRATTGPRAPAAGCWP